MSLNDLERELYGQSSEHSSRFDKKPLQEKKIPVIREDDPLPAVANPWANDVATEAADTSSRTPFFERFGKGLLVFLIIAIVCVTGVAGFYLYQYFTTKDVAIEGTVPQEVLLGQQFAVTFSINNSSQKVLTSPVLSVSLPSGAYLVGDSSRRVVEFSLDSLAPGDLVKKDIQVVLGGASLQSYEFVGTVSYSYEASSLSSKFEKQTAVSVVAQDSVLALDIAIPEKIVVGEEYEMSVHYRNVGSEPLASSTIVFGFPEGFALSGSEVALDKDTVSLGTLNPNEEGSFVVSGSVAAGNFSVFNTQVSGAIRVGNESVPIITKMVSTSVVPSPLVLSIAPSQKTKEILYPGDRAEYTVSFTNNADVSLRDVVIEIALKGPMYDTSSYIGSGYLNSRTNTIQWTAASLPELKEVLPKASGSFSFSIGVKSSYVSVKSDTDITLALSGVISSTTILPNVAAQKTIGTAYYKHLVGGQIRAERTAYFKEPSTDITNKGSLPPRVGNPVQYTIHWKVGSFATDFSNVVLRASLSEGIGYTGKVKINGTSKAPTYNDRTHELEWNIASLTKGTSPETIFQVEFLPSQAMVGGAFDIMSQTTIEATDTTTGKQITQTLPMIRSKDLSDTSLPDQFYKVNK